MTLRRLAVLTAIVAALFGGGPWCLAVALALTVGDALQQHRRLSRQGLHIGGLFLLRARLRGTGSLAAS